MKQLNTYLEGLLGGTKTGINSAVIDSIISYMQGNKLINARDDFRCAIDDNTINIHVDHGIINMSLSDLKEFTDTDIYQKGNIKEIHFNTQVATGYSSPVIFKRDITILGDDLISIYAGIRKPLSNLNIKAQGVELAGHTTIKDCNIDAHIIFIVDNVKITRSNLKSEYIFIGGSFEKSNIKLLSNLGFIKSDNPTRIVFAELNDNDKPLIDIDPIKELKLKNWSGDTIIIADTWQYVTQKGYALITKNKSTLDDAKNILEMKNGWWAGIFDDQPKGYIKSITNFKLI